MELGGPRDRGDRNRKSPEEDGGNEPDGTCVGSTRIPFLAPSALVGGRHQVRPSSHRFSVRFPPSSDSDLCALSALPVPCFSFLFRRAPRDRKGGGSGNE